MDFLAEFEKAINKSRYFHATNLAIAAGVMAYSVSIIAPPTIVHLTAFYVHTSIEGGRRLHMSKQNNSFLETMNEKLFRPRGLYAMTMTYKPSSCQASEMIDVNTNINSSVAARIIGDRADFIQLAARQSVKSRYQKLRYLFSQIFKQSGMNRR